MVSTVVSEVFHVEHIVVPRLVAPVEALKVCNASGSTSHNDPPNCDENQRICHSRTSPCSTKSGMSINFPMLVENWLVNIQHFQTVPPREETVYVGVSKVSVVPASYGEAVLHVLRARPPCHDGLPITP